MGFPLYVAGTPRKPPLTKQTDRPPNDSAVFLASVIAVILGGLAVLPIKNVRSKPSVPLKVQDAAISAAGCP